MSEPGYAGLRREIEAGTAAATLPGWACGVLDGVAGGRSALRAVRHPLGFLCLPVVRSGDMGVCVHIWSPDAPPVPATLSGVHCHSWELLSFVLYGSLRNVRARVRDAGPGPDPATHQLFEVVSRGDGDELRATGRTVRYAPGEAATHGPGDVYALPAGVFHSTHVPGGPGGPDAATVALGRQEHGGGDLSLGPLDAPSHRTRRDLCGPDETARAARRALGRIDAAHPSCLRAEPSR